MIWPWLAKWALTFVGTLSTTTLFSFPRQFLPWLFIPNSRDGSEYRIIFCNFSAFPVHNGLFTKLYQFPTLYVECLLPGPVIWADCASALGVTVLGALCPATFLSWLHPKCLSLSSSHRHYFPQSRCYSLSSVPDSASLCTCPSHDRHEHTWLTLMNKHNASA